MERFIMISLGWKNQRFMLEPEPFNASITGMLFRAINLKGAHGAESVYLMNNVVYGINIGGYIPLLLGLRRNC
jgi:hypothetical protein